ncbi:MAG: hypothetical protein LBJ15_18370 [Comamonas sp.]|jgi:hypothetical protein|uniref:hypothetical protein n=1 Tax=Comamonas sp. TaxID=34028 RepID=UPI00281DA26E|nr:hypothetical protein [Comamonas sp.]MDR0215943.1 hypothetical protein [Comamonas sp.]
MSNSLSTQQAATAPAVLMGFNSLESFEFLQRSAKAFSNSTMVPPAYQAMITKGYGQRATVEPNPAAVSNCMIALDMAQRLQANPLMVMQNLHIIEGRPSWSSQFIIAAINSCGRFSPLRFDLQWLDDMDANYSTFEWVDGRKVEQKHTVRIRNARCVAWAVERGTTIPQFSLEDLKAHGSIYRCCKHYGIPIIESPPVTMEMAVNEGWYSKNGSKWRSMPDLMMQYRTAAFFGRIYAPELLMGLPTDDEVRDVFVQDADGNVRHEGARSVPPSMGTVETVRPVWADEDWAKQLPKVLTGIAGGKTVDEAIAWLMAKADLTAEQESQLRAEAEKLKEPDPQDIPAVDPEKLIAEINSATTLDAVYERGGLIDAIADPAERQRVTEIFEARIAALEQA